MECPSCGAVSNSSDCCTDLGSKVIHNELPEPEPVPQISELNMNSASEVDERPQAKKSTLIEFPGVSRNSIPEWRKELSEKVREVQERKAREAAKEAAEAAAQVDADIPPPQLNLLPPAEVPAMNPLVAAALKRIERAHQTTVSPEVRQTRNVLAAAVAYAPAREEHEPVSMSQAFTPQLDFEPIVETQISEETTEEIGMPPQVEKTHNLVVVAPVTETEVIEEVKKETVSTPKRLIVDDDPALNYLDSISRSLRVDELDTQRAAKFRRLVAGLFDLVICAALTAPIAFAARSTGNNLQDPKVISVLAGCFVVVTFLYLTLNTALTGRTWAMRLFSLRVIDRKTGLIPTGGQSIGRSFLYLISLALAGLGILYALISREGDTAHDQITRTAVIRI